VLALVVLAASGVSAQTDPANPDAATPPPVAPTDGPAEGGTRGIMGRMRAWTEKSQLLARLNGDVDGWYPRLGGITRGSGFAAGPGIRGRVLGDAVFLDLSGAISTRGYKALDARARWLEAFDRRVEVWTEYRYEDFPQEDFFGTGMGTTPDMRTSYDFDSSEVTAQALVRVKPWARIGVSVGYMSPDISNGADDEFPSIEERFTDADAPGLLDQPDFLHTTLSGRIDYRDTAGNTASGGLYRASYSVWNDVTLNQFDFHQFDLHLAQFVPLVPSRSHIVLGRIGASYVNNATGHRVPFYFLAYVGGADTIRSFREFRFKDENALWISTEYRWRASPFLSLALFGDAGETRANWEDVDLKGMRTGYGIGVGFHSDAATIARLDVGRGGGEGWRFFIKFNPTF
jgi:hypothetical protein